MGKYLKILTFLLSISSKVFSIESGDSVQRNINALMYLGVIDMQFSYYQLDGESSYFENHYTYQPLLNKQHILNFEIGVVKSFQQEGRFITPSDFKLAYQYNLHKNTTSTIGFMGSFTGARFILPTGNSNYLSGDNSWIIEPTFGSQWRAGNKLLLYGYRIRYNYSFAALPERQISKSYARFETYLAYENEKIWFMIMPDYRYTPETKEHNAFIKFDLGYSFHKDFGIIAEYNPRVIGNSFYKYNITLGAYLFF